MVIEHNSRTEFYRTPFGAVTCGEKVRLKLSLAADSIPDLLKVVTIFKDSKSEYNLKYLMTIAGLSVYEAEVCLPENVGLLWYYFEISLGGEKFFYGNNSRMLGGEGEVYEKNPKPYQITVYSSEYKTPDWFEGAVMYQIFPDRFCNGNANGEFLGERNGIIKREWGATPFYKGEQFGGKYLANDFFGGNLKGIKSKLAYLAELGIDVIYLNPIFKAYSNHKYDTGDYMQIDETFGTDEDFTELCVEAEKFGIKIILDGVFNHTGSNSIYFNKDGEYDSIGAYQSRNSEYAEWYSFIDYPDVYEAWWGIDTLPAINEESESYRDYILRNEDAVVKHWLKKGASGWRLDVVDELPDDFVKLLRKEVKKENPDAVIIGEVWEDASNKESYGKSREYLLGFELDSVMNYPFRNAMIDIVCGRINAEEFDERLMSIKENYPKPAYNMLMNFLSTHDVERILTVVSSAPKEGVDKDFQAEFRLSYEEREAAKKKVKQLVIFQMLMPGVPSVFYGDEIGAEGYADPFCRSTFDWNSNEEDLRLWYKLAIALRKTSTAYQKGEFENIYKYELGYGFIRYDEKSKHIALANFSNEHKCFRIDLARFDVHYLSGEIYGEMYSSEDGIYYIEMPGNSVKVFSGFEY